MKELLKLLLPKPFYLFLREQKRRVANQRFFSQGVTSIQCGKYNIEAPEKHLLLELVKTQPYRDACVGIAAKYLSAKYPNGVMLDIGANIGDTAAIIATYAPNSLILIEASDYFHNFLVRNTTQFPNEVKILKTFISDGSEITGTLNHWGGTAFFQESSEEKLKIPTTRLCNIADANTCFIKIDTDGYDFKILIDSLEWLAHVHPAIIFENQIRDEQDLGLADYLFEHLVEIGYRFFVVWDDQGFHLVSTSSLDVLADLNYYMLRVFQNDGHKSIYNYDVLCLHEADKDIYLNVREWYKRN